jgi:hypothetical protein
LSVTERVEQNNCRPTGKAIKVQPTPGGGKRSEIFSRGVYAATNLAVFRTSRRSQMAIRNSDYRVGTRGNRWRGAILATHAGLTSARSPARRGGVQDMTGFSAYDQLYVYAGSRGRDTFILQLVVDAHGAQIATEQTKPIAIVFALVGLYLHVEEKFSGLHVQTVHMQLGRKKHEWPAITLPAKRGNITAEDVLNVPAGAERDVAISRWCRAVWEAYAENRGTIVDLLRRHRVI